MAILIFALSLVLLLAGGASSYASLDLLPTGDGLLYALAGAVALCAAVVTFAIAVAIRRIDTLARLIRQSVSPAKSDMTPARVAPPAEEAFAGPAAGEEAPERLGEAVPPEEESSIDINGAGHLPSLETTDLAAETSDAPPSLETTEPALETPEAPPSVIGRYSSGGASYKIFADGSIEAELSEGTFKFASMSEFKGYLSEKKADRQAGE
jgi:hypothetical protein